MTVKGAYFVDNHGPGIDATSGITLVQGSGFENNQGTGAIVQGSANFSDDTFSTYGPQMTGIGGYLAGGQVTVIGDLAEYYGPGSAPLVLANVQGQGTLALAGNGTVVAGPDVAVTGGAGALTTVIEAQRSTSLVQVANDYFRYPVGGSSGPQLSFNGAPVTVGEFGSWMPIGAEQTASGYEVAWKVTDADQYTLWNTDSSGNFLSGSIGVVSGSSSALEALEPSFQQDLNNDGLIGPPATAQLATGFDNSGTLGFDTAPANDQIGNVGTLGSDTAFASTQANDGIGNGGSGAGNLALLTNYLASTFVTPAGEATGVVAAAQPFDQEFLAKPIA
jgi:hypothetical protein